ncbi:chromosome segregation protein SMC [Clostridium sp.]|uniref:chromosome segregation protein SMC n=1 Tax=Clostridium sp. TaxID=1506 RepID=UPI00261526F8|nr:chromosome segregation protein SMC [Clostridium sp.]
MFLKSLEIRGFKSFADKTELNFKKGITAIVGPNGSGKSNVSDSVRWVLGEQSAKTLRGTKMEDVIFTGTEFRKAIGYAEVSLTLDNSTGELPLDYLDVKVTRKLFRSGESEYLINNSPCRLKDVVNLFMDTGIGKEGYSLIGQGKIDSILSGKPEERRAILEEAAGIVKFKSRKVEAERKLKNTEENLVRINDIIFTYEERLGPLEEEKNKALRYLELSNELKHKEISSIMSELHNIDGVILKQKEKILDLKAFNEKQKEKYKEEREKLFSLKNQLDSLENNHSKKQEEYFNKKEEINRNLGKINLLAERIKNIEDLISKNKEELKDNKKKVATLMKEKNHIEKDFDSSKEKFSKELVEINKLEEEVSSLNLKLASKEKEVKHIKDEELELLKKVSLSKNKKTMLESELNNLHEKLDSSKGKQLNYDNSLKINLATKITLQNELQHIEEEKKSKETELKERELEFKNILENIKNTQGELNKVIGRSNKLEANKEMLNKLEKQYEGYNLSVKKIMGSVDSGKVKINKNKCKVLGEVLETKAGYETAIEISLGGNISNIITEDENIAKILINHLKENKLGRATFLPLSIIRGKKLELSKNIVESEGFLGIASDLVNFKEIYTNVINYVLGKTIICDNIDNAIKIAKMVNYRHKIVTLSGEIVNAGGALTGGSVYQKNTGIMSRKNEVKSLEEDLIKALEEEKILRKKLLSLNDSQEELSRIRKDLTDKIYEKNLDLADLNNKIKNVNDETFKIKNSIKSLDLELKDIDIRKAKIEKEIEVVNEKILKVEDKGVSNSEKVKVLEKECSELSRLLSKKGEKLTNMKINKAKLKEVIDGREKEASRIKSSIEEIEGKIISIIKYLENIKSNKEESNKEIALCETFVKSEEENLLSLEENFKAFELKKGKIKEDINFVENSLEVLSVEIAKKDEEVHRNDITFTKQENEKNILNKRLVEEFNTNFDDEKNRFKPIEDIDSHKARISTLKGRITGLGNVNVNAIEEFKEISEKYNFISIERDDLEKAKEELLNVIDEMTSKMRVVFRQNFNILNRFFDETFKELFKGGTAKLVLGDRDELTGNIDINVQPPGKKLQNINLMSGGEKVLSAIALLFSILKMKPTPFCILDEIEAALDDANVRRYAEFLGKFRDNTQFIVITHRKGTMEAADTMYGVTMEEKGISKIVSVDLDK